MREIEDILVDYFGGEELSAEDSMRLEKWLEEGKDAGIVPVLERMRVGKMLREELEREPEAGMEAIRCRWRRTNWWQRKVWFVGAVAAVALLVIGLVFLFKSPAGEKKVNGFADDCTLVTLKLDNGKVLPLRADRTNEVIVKDSFSCIENDNSTLICMNDGIKEDNEEVAYHTITVPVGAEYRVLLPDGTKVHLNADSEFRFPEMFAGENREVYLKGEGYFEVAKDTGKPFIVEIDGMEVKVYGTKFNINTRRMDRMHTTLVEGSVSVKPKGKPEVMLEPSQQAVFNKLSGRVAVQEVDVMPYVAWHLGNYFFENKSISEILDELALWYDINVFFMNDEVRNERFSGYLPRYGEIEKLLGLIEKTSHVHFEIKGKVIVVRK